MALNISVIRYENRTEKLKEIKPGDIVEFELHQDIETVITSRKGHADELHYHINGKGGGKVAEVKGLSLTCEDDEYQEIEIVLEDGYADKL